MSSHTPAPWEYDTCLADHGNKSTQMFSEAEGADFDMHEPVCIIPHDDITEVGYEQVKANARLIAAAPDLLEALDATTRYLRETLALPSNAPILPIIRSLVINGEEAVKKATGRE